jgi:hypothetical protein
VAAAWPTATWHLPMSRISLTEVAEIRRALPGYKDACIREIQYRDPMMPPHMDVDECYEMTPSRRYRGLWRGGFEVSIFCPEPARRCDRSRDKGVWLSGQIGKREPAHELYAVDFIGRRTRYPGGFGHINAATYELVVDRLLSRTPVPD